MNQSLPSPGTMITMPTKHQPVLDLIRKEKKSYAEVANIYRKNESPAHEMVKKKKRNPRQFCCRTSNFKSYSVC